jgi:hypothetical protein
VAELSDSPSQAERAETVAQAVGIWVGYPMLGEAIECHPYAADEEKYGLRRDLDYAHFRATRLLMLEAERAGLNPAPLSEERRICQELFKRVQPVWLRDWHAHAASGSWVGILLRI